MSAGQGEQGVIRVLGTGGTIAGVSHTGRDRDYQAASLSVQALVDAVPELAAVRLQVQQVCQVDSKDMGWPQWRLLLQACLDALHDPEVAGVVITHGTDTLEETALLLQVLLPPLKPVVLTAAMRPATSSQADGPVNLLRAVRAVQEAVSYPAAITGRKLHGVAAALHGHLWPALRVRKAHSWIIDAFDGGGMPAAADGGAATWPPSWGFMVPELLQRDTLPWVPLLTSHADAQPQVVAALLRADPPPAGWLLATTGHGTVHAALETALQGGQPVWRASRVARGGIAWDSAGWPSVGPLTPAQGRLLLSLALAVSGAEGVCRWLDALRAEPGLAHLLMQD